MLTKLSINFPIKPWDRHFETISYPQIHNYIFIKNMHKFYKHDKSLAGEESFLWPVGPMCKSIPMVYPVPLPHRGNLQTTERCINRWRMIDVPVVTKQKTKKCTRGANEKRNPYETCRQLHWSNILFTKFWFCLFQLLVDKAWFFSLNQQYMYIWSCVCKK